MAWTDDIGGAIGTASDFLDLLGGGAASGWLGQLQHASWRGVPFQVDTLDMSAGDDTVLREYPFQDLPTVFSMGEGAEEIKISGYVIGDDYLDQLDKLRAVLKGDGVLIHPTQGSIRCWVHGKYSIRENPTAEGGMARIDMVFVRAEARRYPAGVGNTTDQVLEACTEAEAALADCFDGAWDLAGMAGWARDNLLGRVHEVVGLLWDGMALANQGISTFQSLYREFVTFPYNLVTGSGLALADSLANMLRLPGNLNNDQAWAVFQSSRSFWPAASAVVADTYQSIGGTLPAIGNRQALDAALEPSASPFQTATRQREAASLDALAQLVDGMTTIWAAQSVAQLELDNYNQAQALRVDFNQRFSDLLRAASRAPAQRISGGRTAHDALAVLHTAVLRDLQSRSRDLARLTTYTPQSWQPALYISYRLFGTVGFTDEILAMNRHVEHPLLVPPGVPLRIIRH